MKPLLLSSIEDCNSFDIKYRVSFYPNHPPSESGVSVTQGEGGQKTLGYRFTKGLFTLLLIKNSNIWSLKFFNVFCCCKSAPKNTKMRSTSVTCYPCPLFDGLRVITSVILPYVILS